MTLYRVECPVTIVLVNHWKDQWVLPGNAGIQVPQYFLQYVQTLPLHNTRTTDDEPLPKRTHLIEQTMVHRSFHRVDLFLPPDLFLNVCNWLHAGKNLVFNDNETTARFLELMVTPWSIPVPLFYPLESAMVDAHNRVVAQWYRMYGSDDSHTPQKVGEAGCTRLLNEQRRKQGKPTFDCVYFIYAFSYTMSFIGGKSIYSTAKTILSNRLTFLESADVWFRHAPTIPDEIQPIAQMIALTKKISVDEALAQCVKVPLNPSASFWINIESHIGQTSWRLLQKMHLDGRLDVTKPTFDAFLDALPEKFDDASRSIVKKLFEWAERVDRLTKPDDDTQKTESAAFM